MLPMALALTVVQYLRPACKAAGLEFRVLIEESITLPVHIRERIGATLGKPTLASGADWGWVHRPRLWWGIDCEAIPTQQPDFT